MFSWLKKKLFGREPKHAANNSPKPSGPSLSAEAKGDVSALKKHGNELLAHGNLPEATQCYRQAIDLVPNDVSLLVNLGFVLSEQHLYSQACLHLEKAIQLDPKQDDAFYVLAGAYRNSDQPERAVGCMQRTLQLKPDFTTCRLELCRLLFELGNIQVAKQVVAAGLAIQPESAELHFYLGNLHHESRDFAKAIKSFECAISLKPEFAEAYGNLANSLQELGDLDAAVDLVRKGLKLNSDLESGQSNLLFWLNYHPDKSAQEIFAAYRGYDELTGLPLRGTWREHANARDPGKRLRVGYVSPDFRMHATRHFLEPLLAHHDKREVEVYAYAEQSIEDAVTARYRGYVDHWVPTIGLSDEALSERIRADGIDILVDLAGHTSKNRLGAFARKPAPVSLSWMGFGYTTGLSAIDYFLTDDAVAPQGSEALFAEQPWRLATPGYAFRPAEGMGEVSALPALKRGFITFGTLTRAVRINHRSIRVWSQILQRVPGSRLVVDSSNYRDESMRTALLAKFAAHGIAPARLELGFHSPPWDVLRDMDIGLDCFPHNSGTTLFESLYMGVPFVTLAGRPSVGRLGSSILQGVGHPEWIAYSEDEYADLLVALASDLPKLSSVRAGLRAQMQACPMLDEGGFVRKVEAAYRQMFGRWASRFV